MILKEKLEALGFKKTCVWSQYWLESLDIYVYLPYDEITSIQVSKAWHKGFDKFTYKEYLKELKKVMNKLYKLF